MNQYISTPSPAPTLKLSPEEVRRKYAPKPDKEWTPEREAAFFASLSRLVPPVQSKEREVLVREYARATLGALRMSRGYVDALGAVLGAFADADRHGQEVRLSQRMAQYGTPQTVRTIQSQMAGAGLLTKDVRSQGGGFVGAVFTYKTPKPRWPRRKDLEVAIERWSRPYPPEALADIGIDDVPF